jgi:acetyl esterase
MDGRKPLHPQAKLLVDGIAAAQGPAVEDVDLATARTMYEAFSTMVTGEDVALVEDATVPGPAGDVPVRLYVPADAPSPAPTLVWFHGGGWVVGNLETADASARCIANRSGAAVVSVDYRLAPEHPCPAAVDDALAALRAVTSGTLAGLDPARVSVGGTSAGGAIAAVVARRWRDESTRPLRLQVLVCPVTDLTMSMPSYEENAEGYYLTRSTMEWFIGHYLGDADPSDPGCSPLHADDLAGVAPALVVTAGYDPLRDEGDAYAARLAEAGVEVDHLRFDDQIHDFPVMVGVLDDAEAVLARVGAAVRTASG